jgi:hypothetical protein
VRIRTAVALLTITSLAACGESGSPPGLIGATGGGGETTGGTSSRAPQSPGGTFKWPDELENSPALSFPSAADAVAFLGEYMDGDIALPTSLPSNVRLDVSTSVSVATTDGVWRAWVTLDTQQGDVWGIMYGRSGLDGCDGERHARSVTVTGQPELLHVTADPEGSSRKWVQLIWPATLKDPEGVYGLFGWLSPSAVVAMAESMPVVDAPPVAAAAAGC